MSYSIRLLQALARESVRLHDTQLWDVACGLANAERASQ
ncbi:Uncharacterised protein [Yersinia massiliensis]|nr:Uncharacterised protein [Yersinia massiliensis]